MAAPYIPKNKSVGFGRRSENHKSRVSDEAYDLVTRMAQFDALNKASKDPMSRDIAARNSIVSTFSSSVGEKTKAEAYHDAMSAISGGVENEFRYLPSFMHTQNQTGYQLNEGEKDRLKSVVSSVEKYGAKSESIEWTANISKSVSAAFGYGDPIARAEKAISDLESSPAKFESTDKQKYIEAALLNVSYDDYMSGAASESFKKRSEVLVGSVVDDIAKRAHSEMEKNYALRDYDVEKSIRIDTNPDWKSEYPNEIDGERTTTKTDLDKFSEWKKSLQDGSPIEAAKARLLDDAHLRAEYEHGVVNPNESKLNEAVEINNRLLGELKVEERVKNERDVFLTSEEKQAEFNMYSEGYNEIREENTRKVRERILKSMAAENNDMENDVDDLEAYQQYEEIIAENQAGENLENHADYNEINSDNEVSQSQPDVAERGTESEPAEVNNEKSPEVEEAHKPRPMDGSDINLKTNERTESPKHEVEEKAKDDLKKDSSESYKFSDLTAEQKASLKTIGVYGDNAYQDMSRMREVQVRTMFADYLQNTPEGQKEFEQYVQRTSKSVQERNGVKAEDLYENRMAYLMQIDSAKMEEQFPEAAKALSEERASIDVSEELDIIKREIDPEVDATPEAKKAAVEDLRMQKQIDLRIGPEGQPSLSERIKNSAKNGLNFRKEDGSINKTKILTTSLAGLGMGAAVLGGPAGIAAYIGVKTAVHYAKKAIYAQENFDKGVINALDKGGLASPETIEKKKQEIAEKEQGKSKWSKFLKGAAVLGVGIAAGIAIGDIAGDDIKTGFKDLYEGGMELFKNADLSSGSTIGDGITELQEGIVTEAANNLDPDASVGPTNGDPTPEVDQEAVDAAVEVAGSMTPEVDQEAVDAAVKVASLTHTVVPGDTMGDIALKYLSDRGVDTSTINLWGPDGVLSQVGMNRDLIMPGEVVDLTRLEGYIQNNLSSGLESTASGLDVGSESGVASMSPAQVDNVFPTSSPAHDAASHAFLANLAEIRPEVPGVESNVANGHSWAGEPVPDDAVRLGGGSPAASPSVPEATGVAGNSDYPISESHGVDAEKIFSQVNSDQTISERHGVDTDKIFSQVNSDQTISGRHGVDAEKIFSQVNSDQAISERYGVDTDKIFSQVNEELGIGGTGPEGVSSPESASIDELINKAVESVPGAVAPSDANAVTMEEAKSQIEDALRGGGFAQVTMSDAGVSIQEVDGLPYGMEREDLHSAEDLYDNDDNGPSGP